MSKLKKTQEKEISIMHNEAYFSVDTKFKRVLKATASMLLIIALTITMLTVSGLGTNRAYADTSTSTSSTSTKYAVLVSIRDQSGNYTYKNPIYIYSTKTADEIKADFTQSVENYLKAKNSNIISVTINDTVDVQVTPVSVYLAAAKTASAQSSTALTSAVSETVYSMDDAIAEMLSDNYFNITTVAKSTSVDYSSYKTVYKKTSKLRKTVSKVSRAGKKGSTTKLYYVTTTTKTDGTSTSDTQYVSTTTQKSQSKVVLKGTGTVSVKRGNTYSGTSGKAIVKYAKKFVGNPYVYGGTSLTHGCDCSGFVQSIYKHFGLQLPRVGQCGVGKSVSMSNLKPGDILTYSGHVAIYAGNGKIVHAVTEGQGIRVTSMYYGGTPYRATRIVK